MTLNLAMQLLGAFTFGFATASLIWKTWYTKIITKAQDVIAEQSTLIILLKERQP